MKRFGLHRYAVFVAACTLLVIISGAAVTSSRDQARQALLHNVHIAVAVADAILIAGLVRLHTRAGWSVLAIAVADALVGGTLHAFLAAVLFAALAAIALFASPHAPETVEDYGWPSLRFLSAAAAVLVAVQVAFGAGFRHGVVSVMPHLLGALVVALFIMIVGAFVTHQFPTHATLRPLAVRFMTITGIQVFLGLAVFLMRLMNMAGTLAFLAASVAHVAAGNLIFAVSVMLALEIRRCVRPRVPA